MSELVSLASAMVPWRPAGAALRSPGRPSAARLRAGAVLHLVPAEQPQRRGVQHAQTREARREVEGVSEHRLHLVLRAVAGEDTRHGHPRALLHGAAGSGVVHLVHPGLDGCAARSPEVEQRVVGEERAELGRDVLCGQRLKVVRRLVSGPAREQHVLLCGHLLGAVAFLDEAAVGPARDDTTLHARALVPHQARGARLRVGWLVARDGRVRDARQAHRKPGPELAEAVGASLPEVPGLEVVRRLLGDVRHGNAAGLEGLRHLRLGVAQGPELADGRAPAEQVLCGEAARAEVLEGVPAQVREELNGGPLGLEGRERRPEAPVEGLAEPLGAVPDEEVSGLCAEAEEHRRVAGHGEDRARAEEV
mmetsp:Transcript_14623/g.49520  ORF Transcript_14623/g.49520 Transcript_14623/m.49520 type:complete len:364 (-) Transcript_14623:294-1385(-)